MPDHAPVPHPEILRLQSENGLLRGELAKLLTEADELIQVQKPHLLALYQTKLGRWEMESLAAQIEYGRLKRRLELAQAAINRGEVPDPVDINLRLDHEFADWQRRLGEAATALAAAEDRMRSLLPAAEAAALRQLYHDLVKRLHPDANPGLTAGQRQLWHRVQAAFRAADLEELRALALLVETPAGTVQPTTGETLAGENARLRERIAAVLKQMADLQAAPPFTLRQQLADEAWLAARRGALDDEAAELRARAVALRRQLQSLLPDDGFAAGQN